MKYLCDSTNSQLENGVCTALKDEASTGLDQKLIWKIERKLKRYSDISCLLINANKWQISVLHCSYAFPHLRFKLLNITKDMKRQHIIVCSTVIVYLPID